MFIKDQVLAIITYCIEDLVEKGRTPVSISVGEDLYAAISNFGENRRRHSRPPISILGIPVNFMFGIPNNAYRVNVEYTFPFEEVKE